MTCMKPMCTCSFRSQFVQDDSSSSDTSETCLWQAAGSCAETIQFAIACLPFQVGFSKSGHPKQRILVALCFSAISNTCRFVPVRCR